MTRILVGDCREVLAGLPDCSVQMCCTSPPYFGLRDYGHDGQIGLEATPDEFVAEMVGVFREVRRVLRDDGTLWLNLGDSYAAGGNGAGSGKQATNVGSHLPARKAPVGFKAKDLIGIPWMVAFALRADGWYLRQEIIWHKPNPMPESVQDRCTKAHEQVFLFSKSGKPTIWRARDTDEWSFSPRHTDRLPSPTERDPGRTLPKWRSFDYFFDAAAIAEPATGEAPGDTKPTKDARNYGDGAAEHRTALNLHKIGVRATRNRRSVWSVSTQPFTGAHFATMPPALADLCIRAGSRPGDMVLDPFGGAGTTGLVADRLQRQATLIELNPTYAAIARERIMAEAGLFAGAAE